MTEYVQGLPYEGSNDYQILLEMADRTRFRAQQAAAHGAAETAVTGKHLSLVLRNLAGAFYDILSTQR